MPNALFADRRTATQCQLLAKQTLRDFLAANGLAGKLEQVARYNWGTKEPVEINRMLIERLGCQKAEADPLDSELDPAFALDKIVFAPGEWKPAPLELDKQHEVKIRRRRPVPAVAIAKLTSRFVPDTGSCEIEYLVEGVQERAKDVDVEVHASRYYELNKAGGIGDPCGTVTGEAGTTHIYQKKNAYSGGRVAVAQKETWKGESQATAGVLEKKGVADCWINAGCAPYNVMLRYYKDAGDAKAKITLAPFFPRWNARSAGPPDVDDTSLVVEWTISDDNGKLKGGQLLIRDKSDTVVFFAPLDEGLLRGGKYNLLTAAKAWNRGTILRSAMPYRVEIQAHSDGDEENGLAIAVMPTQMPGLQYEKVQLIAFNAGPGTTTVAPTAYLGDPDDDVDIKARCDVMKAAVKQAALLPEVKADEDVLKVFMAPEFYFRGRKGAYELEKLSTIPALMSEETDKIEYADWLFVCGTAIGQLVHEKVDEATPSGHAPTKFGTVRKHYGVAKVNAKITNVDNIAHTKIQVTVQSASAPAAGWKVTGLGEVAASTSLGGADWELTLDAQYLAAAVGPAVLEEPLAVIETVTSNTEIVVRSKICARIPAMDEWAVDAVRWTAVQGVVSAKIVKVTPLGGGQYTLQLKPATLFALGDFELHEPLATEVFNVAIVKKGWPAPLPGERALKDAIVYKEYVSPIDFLGTNYGKHVEFHGLPGLGRTIQLDMHPTRTVLPTDGSRDLMGARPNVPLTGGTWLDKQGATHRIGTQLNTSGIGGGTIFTIDGVTFGLEVCLDHAKNMVANFYKNEAQAGDPILQVHLIPSWGMTIGGGELCAPTGATPHTLTFNVDGGAVRSILREHDGSYSCDTHTTHNAAVPGDCPNNDEHWICVPCWTFWPPGPCPRCTAAVVKHYRCKEPKVTVWCTTCVSVYAAACTGAGHPSTTQWCTSCNSVYSAWCTGAVHPSTTKRYCFNPKITYCCPLCAVQQGTPGKCSTHTTTPLVEFHECRRNEYYYCTTCAAVRADAAGVCPDDGAVLVLWRYCDACKKLYDGGGTCTCTADPRDNCGLYPAAGRCRHAVSVGAHCSYYDSAVGDCPQPPAWPERCDTYYAAAGPCITCGSTNPAVCSQVKRIGREIAPTKAKDIVASAAAGTYFQYDGYVTVYPEMDLPVAAVT